MRDGGGYRAPLQSQRKHSSPAFPQGSFTFTRVHSGKSIYPAQGVTVPAYFGRNAVNVLVPPVPGCTTPLFKVL